MSVRALGIALGAVHLTAIPVLLRAVHLLRRVLSRLTAGRLIADGRKLRATHLGHHVLLAVLLMRWLLLSLVLALPCSLLALTFLFLFPRIFFLLLLRLPLLADFLELCGTRQQAYGDMCSGKYEES